MTGKKRQQEMLNAASSLLALTFAFFLSGVIIILTGGNPFEAVKAIIEGSIGTSSSLILTLQKTIPLIFTGLSVGLGFRAGLFNIGAEGQLYMGAILAAIIAPLFPGIPGMVLLPIIFILAAAAGALWGVIPGWMKAQRGVHEVLTTIMMNYIAIHLTLFLVKGPLRGDPYIIKTKMIPENAELPVLLRDGSLTLSLGIIIAVLTAVGIWFLLEKTVLGFRIKATGKNPEAASAAGFNVKRMVIISMAICGALAGLGGAIEITGLHHTFYGQFSPGYGFDGIAVALIGANNPIGIIFAALLFGALRASERTLQLTAGIPKNLILIIQGLIILFIGIKYILINNLLNRFKAPEQKNESD